MFFIYEINCSFGFRAIYDILKDLVFTQSPAGRTPPEFLPFKSTADLIAFEHASGEEHDALVSIFIYIYKIFLMDFLMNIYKLF